MKRLRAAIGNDLRLQRRNGLYYATAFVLILLTAALSQLPLRSLNLGWLLPAVVLNNLVVTTFYFISGLVLLEKGEGTLTAQSTTPLRIGEYLVAKVVTLTGVALVYNVVLVGVIYGPHMRIIPLVVGIGQAAVIYILVGLIAVTRYESINTFLFPSTMYVGALLAPVMLYVSGWQSWLLYVHPLSAPLVLLRAAFTPVAAWQIVSSVIYGGVWIGLLSWLCQRRLQHFVTGV